MRVQLGVHLSDIVYVSKRVKHFKVTRTIKSIGRVMKNRTYETTHGCLYICSNWKKKMYLYIVQAKCRRIQWTIVVEHALLLSISTKYHRQVLAVWRHTWLTVSRLLASTSIMPRIRFWQCDVTRDLPSIACWRRPRSCRVAGSGSLTSHVTYRQSLAGVDLDHAA